MKKIAILITCHNRREKTLLALKNLFSNILPNNFIFKVFLVDDGSTDGTKNAVLKKYPNVTVIDGNGSLFWNQGMRLAWSLAEKNNKFDYFVWLNDDTFLDKNAIQELLECDEEIRLMTNKPGIISGACRNSLENNEFSYGGKIDKGPVLPNGEIKMCKYINGNIVLIPKEIHKILGNLSNDYTHAMGDYDYGLRSINVGFKCYTTKSYIATCPTNDGIPEWCDPNTPRFKRWKLLHSERGLNIKEYIVFRKKFWGNKWVVFTIKAYFKAVFPKLFNRLAS